MNKYLLLLFIFFSQVCFSQTKEVSVEQYGAKGDGATDDYNSFSMAANSGASIIKLQDKTYYLDNGAGDKLSRMLVAHNVTFEGGNGTVIKFTYNGLPLFSLTNSEQGGFKNIKFVYAGNTQTKIDYTVTQLIQRLQLKIITSPYELSSVILASNCNNLNFLNLSFESQTPRDTTKGIGFCINVKSKDALPSSPTYNLKISNITVKDCDIGLLIEGQQHFSITNIESENRFGSLYFPPGHVIYLVATGRNIYNKYGVVRNIFDFGNPDNLGGRCLATLAPKCLDSCVIDNVVTLHPEGIAQSVIKVNNSKFSNLIWIKNDNTIPTNPFINFYGPGSIYNNTFTNIMAFCTNTLPIMAATSNVIDSMRSNSFNNIYAYVTLNYKASQRGIQGFLDINGHNNNFSNIYLEPSDLPEVEKSNMAVVWRNKSSSNLAKIVLKGKFSNQWGNKMTSFVKSDALQNSARFNSEKSGINDVPDQNKFAFKRLNLVPTGAKYNSLIPLPVSANHLQILYVKINLTNGSTVTNSYLCVQSFIEPNHYKVIPMKLETPDYLNIYNTNTNLSVNVNNRDYGDYFSNANFSYLYLSTDDFWANFR